MNKRFIIPTAVFVLLCIAFTAVLAVVQIKGPGSSDEDRGLDVRTDTVFGERGRIFDRNGVLLVDNSSLYDLIFEYGAMPNSRQQINRILLDCLALVESTGNSDKLTEDLSPFAGSYPNLEYSSDAHDTASDRGYHLNKFLVRNKMKASITSEKLAEWFVNKYKIAGDKYSDGDRDKLIRLYYNMARCDFGAYNPFVIAKGFDLSEENGRLFSISIEEKKLEGTAMKRQKDRAYVYPDYAEHLLGRIGRITAENKDEYKDYPLDAYVGISGCERTFEEFLRGSDGKRVRKYNSRGELVEQKYDPMPIQGKDIYLTIDIKLQIAAEDSLGEEIESLESAENGAATAIDAENGEVLVLASHPKYGVSQWNRALEGTYAPGSTYKVGMALAALESGLANTETYNCNHVYDKFKSNNPTCLGTHGDIDVIEALRVSCNIFFYNVGNRFGLDSLTPYTEKLGLGVPTGIELDEKIGYVASEKINGEWSDIDDATGAIGQSTHLYTPLQISVYTAAIADRGVRYSAHILKEARTRSGEVVFKTPVTVVSTLEFSEGTYNTLIDAMGKVVSTTLTSQFRGLSVSAGGKTGTAETGVLPDNALFTGFAPLEAPKIVGTCVIEKGEHGSNAARVVADIFKEYYNTDSQANTH